LSLALGALPARAARVPIATPRSVGASAKAGTRSSLIGAESRVDISQLIQDGTRVAPPPAGHTVHDSRRGVTSESVESSADGAYTALPPTRLLDTRVSGEPGPLGPNSTISLPTPVRLP
jgi:hypothetical protein